LEPPANPERFKEFDNGELRETYAPTHLLPRGFYHFNNHLNVKAACHIIGESGWDLAGDAGEAGIPA
jgi:hypothetical protein